MRTRLCVGIAACSIAALAATLPDVAWGQEAPSSSTPPPNAAPDKDQSATTPEASPPEAPADPRRIVVIGQRVIIAALQDLKPEEEYDEDRIASYGASTIGELLDAIEAENGDDKPALLINGEPVHDLGDVAGLPVEALRRIEKLPRGAAQRIGGAANQRAYNIVLKPYVKNFAFTLSRKTATEGGWGESRGEAVATYVHGQDRLNLTFRHSDSNILLESDRGVVPRTQFYPYSRLGNVIPFAATQVDPVLSASVGHPVAVVALDSNPQPTRADILAGADLLNPDDTSAYRSLRGSSQPYDISLAGNKMLLPWLSLAVNGDLNWSSSESLRGVPTGLFLVSANNRYTPFSTPVLVALDDPSRPLVSTNDYSSKSVTATLNANFKGWHASLVGGYSERNTSFASDLTGSFLGGYYTVDSQTNPFAGSLAGLIPVTSTTATSHSIDRQISADAEGPAFNLPTGPVQVRASASVHWTTYNSVDAGGPAAYDRRQVTLQGGVTIPLLGERFLPALGSAELAVDVGTLQISDAASISRYTVAVNWSPVQWLRLSASQVKDGIPVYPELRSAPAEIIDNVPYFDPVRDESAEVQLIVGGTANLVNETELTRTLAATLSPLPKYNLQIDAEYQNVDLRNQMGALPDPSSAVVAAFPDRFVRDASGQLIIVDTRSINFADEHTSQLRLGVGFTIPLSPARSLPRRGPVPPHRVPATNLQFNLSHTIILDSTLLIRTGLPAVDLLSGGAIGISGGKIRNTSSATVSLTRGATGLRFNATYVGPSYLQTGTDVAPDLLTFGRLFKFDLRAFVDLGDMMPGNKMAKGTRLSLTAENLFDQRQRVTNLAGQTPQAYQPAYRDAIGRTIMIELRKIF